MRFAGGLATRGVLEYLPGARMPERASWRKRRLFVVVEQAAEVPGSAAVFDLLLVLRRDRDRDYLAALLSRHRGSSSFSVLLFHGLHCLRGLRCLRGLGVV